MNYKLSAWETELIELMLLDADIARELSHTIGVKEIPSPGGQRLYQLCLDEFEEHHEIAFSRLMLRTEEESLQSTRWPASTKAPKCGPPAIASGGSSICWRHIKPAACNSSGKRSLPPCVTVMFLTNNKRIY